MRKRFVLPFAIGELAQSGNGGKEEHLLEVMRPYDDVGFDARESETSKHPYFNSSYFPRSRNTRNWSPLQRGN